MVGRSQAEGSTQSREIFNKLDKTIDEQKLEVKPFNNTDRPAVFMFQPTEFVVLSGDSLSIWEDLMRERVGVRRAPRGPGGSIGACGRGEDGWWDDCDE